MYEEKEYLLHDGTSVRRKKKNKGLKVALIIMVTLCILMTVAVITISVLYAATIKHEGCLLPVSNASVQDQYLHSAIASDAVTCSSVSNNIMSVQGGSAVDGAIAGLICTCAINFHSCGIGGGSFMMVYIKSEKKAYAIDIRERAPTLASRDMYNMSQRDSLIGGKSIAVMGLVHGYYEVHKKFGRLPWATLLQPTIDLLNTGFYVSKTLESAINYFFSVPEREQFPTLRDILTDKNTGKPKKIGDKISIPTLASTLKIIANEPYAMKNGSLIPVMMTEISSAGGIISSEDFNKYEAKWRVPISVNLGLNKTLYTLPPPSSGVLVAFGLNVLSEYKFEPSFLRTCENTGLFYHRLIETMKFAYAKRSSLGDMDFVDNTKLLYNLTSDVYADWIRSLITDDKTHPVKYYQPDFEVVEDHGTSHFSLVSPDGDAVSATSTINYLFGSFVMGNVSGILYNDEMDDFSSPSKPNIYNFPPSPSNFIEPYKRPMSSMSPTIIADNNGNIELVIGASGGSKILSSTFQIAVLAHLFKKDIKESIDAPRVHHQLVPNQVFIEKNLPDFIVKFLEKRGHNVTVTSDQAISQGIKRVPGDPDILQCNADYRKMGLCDGS